jgi:hypothetical protein
VVGAEQRRAAVELMREEIELSERHACVLLDQPRATQRYTVVSSLLRTF